MYRREHENEIGFGLKHSHNNEQLFELHLGMTTLLTVQDLLQTSILDETKFKF